MTQGAFSLVRYAGLPLATGDALHQPWWFSRLATMEEHLHRIFEAAGWDVEKQVAPKDLWPLGQQAELEAWFEEREALRNAPRILDDG